MKYLFWIPLVALSNGAYADTKDLASLELESLMATDVQITSVMKRLQTTSETPASVYVLTSNELMMSGVSSVTQALTLVPGVQVRKIDNNTWAITARATAGRYSSKLLVMLDGQSLHNPGFAGVDWESINIPIYNIERIEVIRGQGGLLWGSNATNGVVNIITKHTEDTRSVITQVQTGTELDHSVSGRFGAELGTSGAYRFYASDKQTAISETSLYGQPSDYGKVTTFGGRADFHLNDDVSVSLQGNHTKVDNGQTVKLAAVTTNIKQILESEYHRNDTRVMTRIDHRISPNSNQMLQISYTGLKGESAYNDEEFDIYDIDYQMNTLINNVQLDWGGNYRFNNIGVKDTDYYTALTGYDSTEQFGAFVQAQIELLPDELIFSLGNKSEHNDFTGWEHQPMTRLMWQPSRNQAIWSSVSQGVRIPSLVEEDGLLRASGVRVGDLYNSNIPFIDEMHLPQFIKGNGEIEAETSLSSELGYRYMASEWNFDLSLFHTKSKNVLAIDSEISPLSIEQILALSNPFAIAAALQETTSYLNFVSDAELTTYGTELVFGWQPNDKFKTELGYSYSSFQYDLNASARSAIGHDAHLNQWFAKASGTIASNHHFYALVRVESGEAYSTDDFAVLDLSWSWLINSNVGLTLTANNLFTGDHLQYVNTDETFTVPTYVQPTLVARLSVEF